MDFDQELDTRGLQCPLPILKTRLAMDGLQAGEVLKVISTDDRDLHYIQARRSYNLNEMFYAYLDGEDYVYFLRKNGAL